jgi:hypothetical protein
MKVYSADEWKVWIMTNGFEHEFSFIAQNFPKVHPETLTDPNKEMRRHLFCRFKRKTEEQIYFLSIELSYELDPSDHSVLLPEKLVGVRVYDDEQQYKLYQHMIGAMTTQSNLQVSPQSN